MKRTKPQSNPYRVRRVWPWTWKTCEVCGDEFRRENGLRWETWFFSTNPQQRDPSIGWTKHFMCSDCAPSDSTFDTVTVERLEKRLAAERRGEMPTKDSDSTKGYKVGDLWPAQTGCISTWVCADATPGAARWRSQTRVEGNCQRHSLSKQGGCAQRTSDPTMGCMETPLGKSVSETPAVTAEVDYQSATIQEACDILNKRNDGQSYSVSGDGKAISIRMNTTGTSHVEIVSTPPADMTREELIARCELLDRLSDEQIELNERRDEWWDSMRIQFEGATFHGLTNEREMRFRAWSAIEKLLPWPTEDNAPTGDNDSEERAT